LKTIVIKDATNAPIEPFDGFVNDGFEGLDGGEGSGLLVGGGALLNRILGSSAIMAMSRPAQPSWLSTAFGS
jgi:hypothetical protein